MIDWRLIRGAILYKWQLCVFWRLHWREEAGINDVNRQVWARA